MRLSSTLVLLACLVESNAQTWTQLPDFPGIARDDAASFCLDNGICVGTGMDVGFQLTNDWYRFDVLSETWSTMASLPATPRQYCASVSNGSIGYLFGGLDSNGPLSELWRYDGGTDTWTQLASLPAPGRYAAVMMNELWNDSILFVCTGMLAGGSPTNELWKYNTITDHWTQKATMPGVRRHRASTLVPWGEVIGGADSSYTALGDGYFYDGSNDSWFPGESLPSPRYSSDGEFGFLFCGASSASQLHDDVWLVYQPWHSPPSFGGGLRRSGVAAHALVAGQLWLYYGTGSDNVVRYKDWWKLNDIWAGVSENSIGDGPRLLSTLVDDHATLVLPSTWSHAHAAVIDASGRVQATFECPNGSSGIDARTFPDGSYFLHVRSNGDMRTLRFAVMH